ncbi:MAG: hypothetical protein LBQ66_05640 [Planctomycetaceae bacterium]|nr:hypothetical protein [Planctomycetaceae bacterium]
MCGITRAGRPRSSPRRFAAIVWYNEVFRPLRFRLAPLAENTTAQRSVAHLTITDT